MDSATLGREERVVSPGSRFALARVSAEDIAWLGPVPLTLLLLAIIFWLAPPLSDLYPAPDQQVFPEWRFIMRPEPLEATRFLVAVAGPALLAVVIVAGLLLGVLQLYALVAGVRALFSKPPSLLRRATISRALLPAYVAGMAAMVIALLGFHEEEKHWIAQDRLMEVTVEAPSMNRFEYQVSQAMIRELQELVKETP